MCSPARRIAFRCVLVLALSSCGRQTHTSRGDLGPAFSTAATFWQQYAADTEFQDIVDSRLTYDGRGAWGYHSLTGFDREIRCAASVVSYNPATVLGSATRSSIDFSPYVVTAVQRWPQARSGLDGDLTVVVAWDAQADQSVVSYVWSSASGNQAVDPTTRNDVATISGARLVGIAIDVAKKRIYVSDVARFLLLRIDDTTQDGVPDALAALPAASHPTYCGDLETGEVAIGIAFMDSGTVEGIMPFYFADPGGVSIHAEERRGNLFWVDSDGDGTIDRVSTWTPVALDRIQAEDLYEGAEAIRVDCAPGLGREMWTLDAAGTAVVERLAIFVPGARPSVVSLSRALVSGESIALTSSGGAQVLWDGRVAAAPVPRISSAVPAMIELGAGPIAVAVTGDRFLAGISVRLMQGSNLVATCPVSNLHSGSLTITIPNLTDPSLVHDGLHLEFSNLGTVDFRLVPFFVDD